MNNHDQNGGEEQNRQCVACQRELRLGDDALAIQQGVIGPRGFVPLNEKTYLCDYVCAESHFNGNDKEPEKLPRKVP